MQNRITNALFPKMVAFDIFVINYHSSFWLSQQIDITQQRRFITKCGISEPERNRTEELMVDASQ